MLPAKRASGRWRIVHAEIIALDDIFEGSRGTYFDETDTHLPRFLIDCKGEQMVEYSVFSKRANAVVEGL